MDKKKKAITNGSAAAIVLYYIISLILLITIGSFYKEDSVKEYERFIVSNGFFIMLFSVNIVSSLLSLLAGHMFVRRYDRKSRWSVTKALMISLMITSAIFLLGSFQPAIFLLLCIFSCIPVLVSHYITYVIRGIILRRKRH